MNVLGVDTTSDMLSLALQAGEAPPAVVYEHQGAGITRVVLDEIDRLLRTAGLRPADLELVVVAVGPGSFTGTRIGMGVAGTFAQVLAIPEVGVDTLHLLAAQTDPELEGTFHAALNCARDEVYHAPFRWRRGVPEAQGPIAMATLDELEGIADGAPVVLRRFAPEQPGRAGALAGLRPAPLRRRHPDGHALLEVGLARYQARPGGPWPRPQPVYLKSEAFRKWRRRRP